METQAGTNVFVVGKDNKVESRKVVAGSSYKQQRVISDGLKHGEKVIIEGVQKVRMAVKPEAASSPKS
ncbi:MAG: hypothetical protein EP304_00445 [Deltaproteobacteria bacterium]|nr:MAG: hypothetical protein EP304_00445 [Deltaproteobacteria bacterium]